MAAAGVFQQIEFPVADDPRMAPGNAGVEQHQVVVALPSQREGCVRDLNVALIAKSVANRDVRQGSGH